MSQDVTDIEPLAHGADPALLDTLIDRLSRLENGLRQELESQVRRAERAEAALATAQAQAATASIAAQGGFAPLSGVATPKSEPATDAALREMLVQLRERLTDRHELVGDVLTVARQAIEALHRQPDATGGAPFCSNESGDDRGQDQH